MLKKLQLIKKRSIVESDILKLLERKKELLVRSTEVEKSIEESKTEEDVALTGDEIKAIEAEQTSIDTEEEKLETELKSIDKELLKLDRKVEKSKKTKEAERKIMGKREKEYEYLQRSEVKAFYKEVTNAIRENRSLTGTDLLIPEVIIDRIESKIIGYSNLINEVDLIQLNGTGRVLFAGDIPDAIWLDCCDPLEELADSFHAIELDCWKLGGFMAVCNATLEDSFINLAMHIEERMAKSIAKGLDKAIINGTGIRQPLGVVKNATETTVTSLKELLAATALVNSEDEVIIVLSGKTLRGTIHPELLLETADGRHTFSSTDFAGFRFVRSDSVDDGKAVLGDFKKYMLAQRKGIQLARSEHVRFVEDQTLFKATGRYDGTPLENDAFVIATLDFPAPTAS